MFFESYNSEEFFNFYICNNSEIHLCYRMRYILIFNHLAGISDVSHLIAVLIVHVVQHCHMHCHWQLCSLSILLMFVVHFIPSNAVQK